MITVAEALAQVLALAPAMQTEWVPLRAASGRVLAQDMQSTRIQPPFAASAMDGYAVMNADVAVGATFTVIGESAAGHRYTGALHRGQAVRIFTGAPMPEGADRVVIQEDVTRSSDQIILRDNLDAGFNVRPSGADFGLDFTLPAPRRLTPADIALLASMNHPKVPVARRPNIAIISTGDELVMPGDTPNPDQIIASNTFGLAAMFESAGAEARILPIARDTAASLRATIDLASDADLIVTIGGASVGDHDIVAQVATEMGLERSFYKIAMRPGKPLMAGRLNGIAMVGLPGNPVSAMVCAALFILPMLQKMQGFSDVAAVRRQAVLTKPVGANGPREHYMRATVSDGKITPFDRQDSALLSVLSASNTLLVRPVNDGPRTAGETVEYIQL